MSNYRVGIYLRLSKEDERLGESGSITNQRSILLNYIKEHNLEYVDEYVDDGVSGTTFDRMGFKRMINDIEEKRINMVITKDTSRLGRDHIEFGYYVDGEYAEVHIQNAIYSAKSNGSGNDIANELEFTKPSISVAMKNLRQSGLIDMDQNGYITLLPEGQEIAEKIYERHTILTNWLIKLGVAPDVADMDACKIEHVISTESFLAIKKEAAGEKKSGRSSLPSHLL